MNNYILFNLIEALLWAAIGLGVFIFRGKYGEKYKNLAILAFVIFILFGTSDVFEALIGNFLNPGMEWLFVWKIVNVGAIIGTFIWYLFLRFRRET